MEGEGKWKEKLWRLWSDVDCGGRLVVVTVVLLGLVVLVLVVVALEDAEEEVVEEKEEVLRETKWGIMMKQWSEPRQRGQGSEAAVQEEKEK